jgi:xanthine/uracil permease
MVLTMKPSTIETLIWVLIYGGLLVLSLSFFVSARSDALATALAVCGSVVTVLGAVLVVVRSRMKDPNAR